MRRAYAQAQLAHLRVAGSEDGARAPLRLIEHLVIVVADHHSCHGTVKPKAALPRGRLHSLLLVLQIVLHLEADLALRLGIVACRHKVVICRIHRS